MRIPALLAALFLSACGGTVDDGPDEQRDPCSSQLQCSSEYGKVCESGYCSADLVKRDNFNNLYLSLGTMVQKPRFLRVLALYQVTPAGDTVTCENLAPLSELMDPTKYNQSAYPIEQPLSTTGDVIITGVKVNGPGRVIYVELYDAPPSEEPMRIGVGCTVTTSVNEDVEIRIKATAG